MTTEIRICIKEFNTAKIEKDKLYWKSEIERLKKEEQTKLKNDD